MDKVRRHYNGYCFGFPEDSERVYNPFTLACCLRDMQDRNHVPIEPSGTPMFLMP